MVLIYPTDGRALELMTCNSIIKIYRMFLGNVVVWCIKPKVLGFTPLQELSANFWVLITWSWSKHLLWANRSVCEAVMFTIVFFFYSLQLQLPLGSNCMRYDYFVLLGEGLVLYFVISRKIDKMKRNRKKKRCLNCGALDLEKLTKNTPP